MTRRPKLVGLLDTLLGGGAWTGPRLGPTDWVPTGSPHWDGWQGSEK